MRLYRESFNIGRTALTFTLLHIVTTFVYRYPTSWIGTVVIESTSEILIDALREAFAWGLLAFCVMWCFLLSLPVPPNTPTALPTTPVLSPSGGSLIPSTEHDDQVKDGEIHLCTLPDEIVYRKYGSVAIHVRPIVLPGEPLQEDRKLSKKGYEEIDAVDGMGKNEIFYRGRFIDLMLTEHVDENGRAKWELYNGISNESSLKRSVTSDSELEETVEVTFEGGSEGFMKEGLTALFKSGPTGMQMEDGTAMAADI